MTYLKRSAQVQFRHNLLKTEESSCHSLVALSFLHAVSGIFMTRKTRANLIKRNSIDVSEDSSSFPLTGYRKSTRISSTPLSLAFLKVYFVFSYFLGFSPFLIHYNQATGIFEIYKSKYNRVICGVLHFFTLFQYLSHFRNIRFEILQINPDNYFELANVIGSLAYYVTIFWVLWRKQSEFLSIAKLVVANFSLDEKPRSSLVEIKRHILPVLLCSVFLGLSVYSVLIGNVATNKWRFLGIPKSYYSRANFAYLFQPDAEVVPPCPDLLLKFLTAWYIFIEVYIWIGSHFTDLLFLTSSIFLRLLVGDFCVALNKRETSSYEGLRLYFSLRQIVQNLNSAIGPVILAIVLTGLPYHSSNIELIFSQEDWARRARVSFYWVIFVISLITAASANSKLEEMKEWLLRDGNAVGISQSILPIVTQELSHTGLKGWGFFTITYGFLGTILSVVLTYAILIVQLHSGRGG